MHENIPYLKHLSSGNFFLLAGPCVVESEEMTMNIAGQIKEITDRLEIPFIFKASYKKANRTRTDSFMGIGDEAALLILKKVRDTYKIPIVTDIHESGDAAIAAKYVDVLQIPAFLCRQTELLLAAASTGKTVNIKKGQFTISDHVSAEARNLLITVLQPLPASRPSINELKMHPWFSRVNFESTADIG